MCGLDIGVRRDWRVCITKNLAGALEWSGLGLLPLTDHPVNLGLVEKRQRTKRDQDGLYTYYRATVFGSVTLTEGVDELIRGECEFESMDDRSSGS
ncbi:hypothetical protein HALLA_20295 (plasmid) [Halostagnicola larsenii XH-48]|uniref:Uncharacterized protein n=1 Tax=Halostagnicola larsenii XH-48 TaxID=797299 RepID=W0JUK4_9EURY|nr:hypothetical protein HALLA_20295 [Halostagnicola larsenii XH-48]